MLRLLNLTGPYFEGKVLSVKLVAVIAGVDTVDGQGRPKSLRQKSPNLTCGQPVEKCPGGVDGVGNDLSGRR